MEAVIFVYSNRLPSRVNNLCGTELTLYLIVSYETTDQVCSILGKFE